MTSHRSQNVDKYPPRRSSGRSRDRPVAYPEALGGDGGASRGDPRRAGAEQVWLLEHPPLYTAGTSAKPGDLLWPDRFPVYPTRRGGEYTYHGPGQRVAYAMLDLEPPRPRRAGLRLAARGMGDPHARRLRGARRTASGPGRGLGGPSRPAAAADGGPAEDKIAAIGVRVRRWVAFHGVAINVEPDLGHFAGIVPCGIRGHGVTSLVDLGLPVTMADLDVALRVAFDEVFGDARRRNAADLTHLKVEIDGSLGD